MAAHQAQTFLTLYNKNSKQNFVTPHQVGTPVPIFVTADDVNCHGNCIYEEQ